MGGGGANALMYLSREYARAGHETFIITVWYEGLPEEETIRDFGQDIHITRLKAKRKKKEHCSFAEMLDFLVKADKCADLAVKDAIAQNAPFDICQIFFGIPSGPVGYRLKRKYGIPYVIRFGGGDIPGFQERFAKVYKPIGPALRIIWKNADALVANSEGLKKLAQDFCDRYPILVFPNGVDAEKYAPPHVRSYDKDTLRLLFVSRLIERKGLQYVIPHLGELSERTGKKLVFTIVGDGPYRQTLENLADEHHVRHMIEFAGQKGKEDLPAYYRDSDIFVFPSKKEGMPNVVLEAMACGLPVCMSPCQGSSELIDKNGIVAESNLTKFSDSLEKMVGMSDVELDRMSALSRRRAKELFSWESVAKSYMGLFSRITGKNTETKDDNSGKA